MSPYKNYRADHVEFDKDLTNFYLVVLVIGIVSLVSSLIYLAQL